MEKSVQEEPKLEPEKETKKGWKKALDIISWIIIGILIVFDGFAIANRIYYAQNNTTIPFFGMETRLVVTDSMEGDEDFYAEHPEYEITRIDQHSCVFIELAPENPTDDFYKNLKVGDVLTFIDQESVPGTKITNTHRIIAITEKANGYDYTLRGDLKKDGHFGTTQTAGSDYGTIIGKVTKVDKGLGIFLWELTEGKVLMVVLVILPCAVLMIFELGKVIYIVSQNRKQEHLAEIEEKDLELQKLKDELEKIKGEKDDETK